MKQTAVEWLVEQLKEYDFADVKDNEQYIIKIPYWVLIEKEKQAKEMEKEQIMDAHNCGYSTGIYQGGESGEQYYNENYESNT